MQASERELCLRLNSRCRQDQRVPLAGARSPVAGQSRLSDARLAHNHERPAPVGKAIKNCVETLHLSIAADQPKPRRAQMPWVTTRS
jgi:hypothetical protein